MLRLPLRLRYVTRWLIYGWLRLGLPTVGYVGWLTRLYALFTVVVTLVTVDWLRLVGCC